MALRDQIARSLAESVIDLPHGKTLAYRDPDPSIDVGISETIAFLWRRQIALRTRL